MIPKAKVAEQLSMYGLKPTARINNESPGQVMIDILEIAEPPKEMIRYDKRRK